jgi:hypothetical protein
MKVLGSVIYVIWRLALWFIKSVIAISFCTILAFMVSAVATGPFCLFITLVVALTAIAACMLKPDLDWFYSSYWFGEG